MTCFAVLSIEMIRGESTRIQSTFDEQVYTYTSPNNGSGPLWGYGSSAIVRDQGRVFICATETGENIPPLCNTRWHILTKNGESWETWAGAPHYRQREPCLLALTQNHLILSVNDSLTKPGTHYQACQPHLIRMDISGNGKILKSLMPTWDPKARFTDHSYRGMATDPESKGILLLNIDAVTSEQNWIYLNPEGDTVHQGKIVFPIRSCYPQVQLRHSFGAVMAISDIREPNKAWADYKKEQTGREWDYVFRVLYWTANHHIDREQFQSPVEIANVNATAGHISNQDLYVDGDLNSWMLYSKRDVQSELMRDKFFPTHSTRNELWLTKVSKLGERRFSHRIQPKEWAGGTPGWSRFHQTPDGKLWIISFVGGSKPGNWVTELSDEGKVAFTESIPFKDPFRSFLTTSYRNGHAPSNRLDIIGMQSKPMTLFHGRIDWKTVGSAED